LAPVVVAVEAMEVGRRAATTAISETVATMITAETAGAGSTAVVATVGEVVETVAVVEEAISHSTTLNRSAPSRFAETSTLCESYVRLRA